MKQDGFYFPHFSNVRHDRRIKRMEKELGLEAYAIYFKLFEILREQIDFKYPMDDLDLLADEIGTSEQKVRVVICNYQLFQVDECNMFFSVSFNEAMEPYLKMREQRKIAGKASAERRINVSTDAERPFNNRSTDVQQSKVKEIKEKESKEEESKVKESKVNVEVLPFDDDESNEAWKDWIKYRKEIRKPLSPSTTESQINKLKMIAPHTRAAMIKQSIENGWQGLFEIREPKIKSNGLNYQDEITRVYNGLK